jgi:large subunit ribosomal protein L7/L12
MSQRSWSPDVVEIGDRIMALTFGGAAELLKYLESGYGIKPASLDGVVPRVLPEVVIDTSPAETAEFDVVLDGFVAAHRVAAIRVVREATGLGLKEARDLVEGAPKPVKQRLAKAEAEALKATLEAVGARVSLRAAA